MAAAVAAIIEHGPEILLVRRAKEPRSSMLDLPGGFVDYEETAEEALAREIYEELNLQIGNIRYLTSAPNVYVFKDVPYHVLDISFICGALDFENIKAKDDVSEFLLFRPEQIPFDELAFESTKSTLVYYNQSR
jgi:ADP-ribose pyrophosphatase YjhB (NUDIX family)